MGVMKRIETERQIHGRSLARFAPDERKAMRGLIRTSEALLKYLAEKAAPKPTAGGVAMSPIWQGMVHTGGKPERAGTYIVVDTVSESREVVQTVRLSDGRWFVNRIGQATEIDLNAFNRRGNYHWFLLSELEPDDMKFVRKELSQEL